MPTDQEIDVAPTAPEMVAGGSYIPQESTVKAPNIKPGIADSKALTGRITGQYPDFMETVRGISDGDPVGMEMFDLGFFEDGTPAITINGANIPIRHEQWMTLLTQRNKMRSELEERFRFQVEVAKGRESIEKIIASGITLPQGAGPLLLAQNEVDPPRALDNAARMYLAVSSGNGNKFVGEIGGEMQEYRNRMSFSWLMDKPPSRKETRPNPYNPAAAPIEVDVPGVSIRDANIQRLKQSNTTASNTTMLAYQRLEDFALDPNIRRAYPNMQVGVFDRIALMESDKYSPMSLWSRLQHIAAYNGGEFGAQIPIQYPIPMAANSAETMALDAAARAQYRDYLVQLDRFAAASFGYDPSTPQAIDVILNDILSMRAAQQMSGESQQVPSQQQPTRSARPSAVR